MLDVRRSALRCAVVAAAVLAACTGSAAASPAGFMALMTLAPAALAVAPAEGPAAVTDVGVVSADGLARATVVVSSVSGGTIESVALAQQRRFAVFDPNDCTGRTLPPGGECSVEVVAAPHGAHGALADQLLVQIDGTVREGEVTAWAR